MTIAYAALLILLIRRVAASAWIVRVAAPGRAAFSNYLGTSIAMTTIFYGYGFGLFGHVDRWTLYLFCAGMWAVMRSAQRRLGKECVFPFRSRWSPDP